MNYFTPPRFPQFKNSYLDSNLEVFLEEILNQRRFLSIMCCLFIVLSYWFFTCMVTSHVLNVVKFIFTVTNVTSLLSMTQHLVIWKNFANNWNPSPGVYTNQELKFIYISLLISISKVVLSSMISCNINLSCCCMCNTW